MPLETDYALWLVTVGISVAAFVQTAELIVLAREPSAGAVLGGHSLANLPWLRLRPSAITPWIPALLWFRLLLCAAEIVLADTTLGVALLPLLVMTQLALGVLLVAGAEGSDQMILLVLVAVTIGRLAGPFSERAGLISLWFIGAQTTLSYFASGAAKLVSPAWRGGGGLRAIMNSYCYGHPGMARLIATLGDDGARVMSWGVIAFQLSFPFALLLPYPYGLAPLALGLLFHLAIAATMSLNLFLLAFPATYPAVLILQRDVTAILR